MVRGPAAVLIGLACAVAYLLAAPGLPDLGTSDAATAFEAALGALCVGASAASLGAVADSRLALVLLSAAAILVAGAVDAHHGRAAASVPEAVAWGSAGALFARAFASEALVLALPVFVWVLDAAGVAATGALSDDPVHGGDVLSLELPAWGGGPVARLEVPEVVLIAVLATWGRRFGLRPVATSVALVLALVLVLVLHVATGHVVPALPFLSAAFFLVNVDRLGGLVRGLAAH